MPRVSITSEKNRGACIICKQRIISNIISHALTVNAAYAERDQMNNARVNMLSLQCMVGNAGIMGSTSAIIQKLRSAKLVGVSRSRMLIALQWQVHVGQKKRRKSDAKVYSSSSSEAAYSANECTIIHTGASTGTYAYSCLSISYFGAFGRNKLRDGIFMFIRARLFICNQYITANQSVYLHRVYTQPMCNECNHFTNNDCNDQNESLHYQEHFQDLFIEIFVHFFNTFQD